jgi:hypothetical protein
MTEIYLYRSTGLGPSRGGIGFGLRLIYQALILSGANSVRP